MKLEKRSYMHFFAGKESALREVLNNLQDKLSKELKTNIVARIKKEMQNQVAINSKQKGLMENDIIVLDKFLKGECKI